MLTENDVVKSVVSYLKKNGFQINSALTTNERGIDITAVYPGTKRQLLVEAKGGTSSKQGTANYGNPFTPSQARSHVAVAFYYAVKLRQQYLSKDCQVAMAFPDDPTHRGLVENISSGLEELGIIVFFVDRTHQVTLFPKRT